MVPQRTNTYQQKMKAISEKERRVRRIRATMKIERAKMGLGNVDEMKGYQKSLNGVETWAKGPKQGGIREFKDILHHSRLEFSIEPVASADKAGKVKRKQRPATAQCLSNTTQQRPKVPQRPNAQLNVQQISVHAVQRRAWSAPAGRKTAQGRPKTAQGEQSYSDWWKEKCSKEKRDRTKWQEFNSLERSSHIRPASAKPETSGGSKHWEDWGDSFDATTGATYLAGIGELAPHEITRSLEMAASGSTPAKAKRRLDKAKERYLTELNKAPFLRPGTTSKYTQIGWM
jgi:hypothetical protein